jgi:hypothetical protein
MAGSMALGVILAHLVGDYLLQSHWMATEKTHAWWPAIAHGFTYTIPYIFVTQSIIALAVICGTHIVIDRYRLARFVVWAKNQLAPRAHRPSLTATGYDEIVPAWLAVWLMIIADNTLHLLINAAAVVWL